MGGDGLDLQPGLAGRLLSLRPLHADDFEALYAAASDPAIWAQHPDKLRHQREHFRQAYFDPAVASGGALVAVEQASGHIIGASRYYDLDPPARELAIGYTFLETRCWGAGFNREMKQLMLEHAFAWARAVWFHIGADNLRSRRAVEKLGAEFVRSQPRDVNGTPCEYTYYRITADQQRGAAQD